jgi:hypothetical protein
LDAVGQLGLMRLDHLSFHSRSAIGKHIIHDDVGK